MNTALPDIVGHHVARLTAADAADWAAYAVLPQMQQFISTPIAGEADLLPMIERALSNEPGAPVLFSVREPDGGRLVATFGFHTISALNRTAEVTYAVRPECWGQGLATAICNAAVDWAFRHRQWVRVQATVLVPHVASQRVLQKCGFELEGRLRNFRIVRGEPQDYLLFARIPAIAGANADQKA